MVRSMVPLAFLGLSTAFSAACSQETSRASFQSTSVDAPGGTTIESAGVRIEVEESVRYRYRSVSTGAGATSSEATLNGHPFGLRDGVFFIGAAEFGPAPAGTVVRVADAGVFVDGARRGDLPAARSPAGE